MYVYAGSSTLDHAVKSALQSTSPPCILFIADFCYAGGLLTMHPSGLASTAGCLSRFFRMLLHVSAAAAWLVLMLTLTCTLRSGCVSIVLRARRFRSGCSADTWYPNGTVSSPNTAVEGNPNAGSYQPVRPLTHSHSHPSSCTVRGVGGANGGFYML